MPAELVTFIFSFQLNSFSRLYDIMLFSAVFAFLMKMSVRAQVNVCGAYSSIDNRLTGRLRKYMKNFGIENMAN
jgi:hypothetical protein